MPIGPPLPNECTPLKHAPPEDDISLIVRVDLGVHGRLGPGKMLLLEHIEKFGSISAAGRAMNMSYRQAWDLVDQLNKAFIEPVVASQTGGKSGGGASLTPMGQRIVAHYRAIEQATNTNAARDLAAIRKALKAPDAA
jgi:molybdate transport system regulatory protein